MNEGSFFQPDASLLREGDHPKDGGRSQSRFFGGGFCMRLARQRNFMFFDGNAQNPC